MASSADTEESQATLKFLVSNAFSGTIIGPKGAAVKELMDVCGARITISGNKEFYPGTSDRVLVITGSLESLLVAISLIWELIYLQTKAIAKGTSKTMTWSPAESKDNLKGTDDIELTAKITIPAGAGGLILGRAGATLRLITETSGATVQMTDKEAAMFTQERVLTITGFVSQGRLCTQLIIQKMCEDAEAMTYANRGTRYNPAASGVAGVRGNRPRLPPGADPSTAPALPVAETTMTMTVADTAIGNIIGKNGATLREMTSLSGAKIIISSRDESTDGNRVISITGEPAAVQNASIFITEKLRMGAYAKRRRTDE